MRLELAALDRHDPVEPHRKRPHERAQHAVIAVGQDAERAGAPAHLGEHLRGLRPGRQALPGPDERGHVGGDDLRGRSPQGVAKRGFDRRAVRRRLPVERVREQQVAHVRAPPGAGRRRGVRGDAALVEKRAQGAGEPAHGVEHRRIDVEGDGSNRHSGGPPVATAEQGAGRSRRLQRVRQMALLLRESHLRELLAMRELIPLMARTLASFSTGGAVQPVRSTTPVARYGGFLGVMPAYLAPPAPAAPGGRPGEAGESEEALGLKAVAFYPNNAARRLPTHLATILLLDPATGALRAVLDGRLITEMRTAAVSAAATDRLARQDARVLAILGAGVQARSHVEALREVRPPSEVRAWSRTQAGAERFAAEM